MHCHFFWWGKIIFLIHSRWLYHFMICNPQKDHLKFYGSILNVYCSLKIHWKIFESVILIWEEEVEGIKKTTTSISKKYCMSTSFETQMFKNVIGNRTSSYEEEKWCFLLIHIVIVHLQWNDTNISNKGNLLEIEIIPIKRKMCFN